MDKQSMEYQSFQTKLEYIFMTLMEGDVRTVDPESGVPSVALNVSATVQYI